MNTIKCLFCNTLTQLKTTNIKRKIGNKMITLSNAPVYICTKCNETFISKEAQDVMNHIKSSNLLDKQILFDYNNFTKK